MKKLIILLFSVFVSINSYSGIFNETICFETDQKNIVFLPNETNAYTGKYSCKYGNGQKEIEGSYKDGRLFGKWTWWYENGQIESESTYKDGKLDGKSTWWNKKGQKVRQRNYKDGKLDGKLIEWFQFDGQIKREENYKNGKICINEC
jgi:antitoxin component YwqK of YwqJK toxin-antitoxin module